MWWVGGGGAPVACTARSQRQQLLATEGSQKLFCGNALTAHKCCQKQAAKRNIVHMSTPGNHLGQTTEAPPVRTSPDRETPETGGESTSMCERAQKSPNCRKTCIHCRTKRCASMSTTRILAHLHMENEWTSSKSHRGLAADCQI